MVTLPNDGNDLCLRRETGGGKGGTVMHRNHDIIRFNITALHGETIDTAELNLYLQLNTLSGATIVGIESRRLIDSGSGVAQTWTEATAAGTIVPVGEYTQANGPQLDSIIMGSATATGAWYQWDIAAGLQADIDATNTYFTACISRALAGTTGTVSTQNNTYLQLRSDGSATQHVSFNSDEFGSNAPYVDYVLVVAGNELEAAPAATSAITAVLEQFHLLTVPIIGASSATANVTQIHQLATTLTASSAVTANLTRLGVNEAAATITATTTVIAALTQLHTPTTPVVAVSAVTANITNTGAAQLAATPAATTLITAVLKQLHQAASATAAVSNITANLADITGITPTTPGYVALTIDKTSSKLVLQEEL